MLLYTYVPRRFSKAEVIVVAASLIMSLLSNFTMQLNDKYPSKPFKSGVVCIVGFAHNDIRMYVHS